MAPVSHQTPVDRAIATLARRQHGVISLPQLIRLGLTTSAVRKRVQAGRLHRLHRGVYAVGHSIVMREGRWMAAVLACGDDAVLSHRSAGELHNLLSTRRTRSDVTSPRRTGRRHDGIAVHSGATLRADDVTRVEGIPCTTVARTLFDLADVLDPHTLQRAVERSETLRVFDLVATRRLLARSNGRRGARRLERAIAAHVPTVTRSEMEALFLAICEANAIPRPLVNERLGDIEPDFTWPREQLIVETDGYETHGTREAFASDRRRDRRLRRQEWRVERFTWREIAEAPGSVGAELAEIFSAAASAR